MKASKSVNARERFSKYFSLSITVLAILFLATFIIFSLVQSNLSIKEFGWKIFSFDFNLSGMIGGVFLPLLTTILLGTLTLLLTAPVSLRLAFLICFRNKNEQRHKRIKFLLTILGGLPSVVFGFFAWIQLSKFSKLVLHTATGNNLFTAILMLFMMCTPTTTLVIVNRLDATNKELKDVGFSLGFNESQIIYKIYKVQIKKDIIRAYFIGFAKAIGETAALMFILNSQNYLNIYKGHFGQWLQSSLKPVTSLISTCFFAENGGEAQRSWLFGLGMLLFFLVVIINALVMYATSKKSSNKIKKIDAQSFKDKILAKNKNYKALNNAYHIYKLIGEYLCLIFYGIFTGWMILDLLINGIKTFGYEQNTYSFTSSDSTLRALANTLYIGLWSVIIIIPLSLIIVIYVNEFCTNGKLKKSFWSMIDIFTSVPSILFGIFGFAIFLNTFGWAYGGKESNSMLAGMLTVSLYILPFAVRNIGQAFNSVDPNLREVASALGLSKNAIIFKLILPKIWPMIINTTILMIAKVASESSPFILTTGLRSSSHFSLLLFGQTLTTRMVAQLASPAINSTNVMYECSMVSTSLIIVLFSISNYLMPKLQERTKR